MGSEFCWVWARCGNCDWNCCKCCAKAKWGATIAARFIYENSKIMTNFCFWPAPGVYESMCVCAGVCVFVFYIVLYFISVIAESTQRGAPSPVPLTAEITAIVLRERGLLSVKRGRGRNEEGLESKRG